MYICLVSVSASADQTVLQNDAINLEYATTNDTL
jgi:hypothetical protein